jgi:hypothetical protein
MAEVFDFLPESMRGYAPYGAGGVGVLVVFLVLVKLMSGGKKVRSPEQGQVENLADYPPPPGTAGPRRLSVEGEPVRVRLVVLAPAGKQQANLSASMVEPLLDQIVRGLAGIVQEDKARIKVWPPQLSSDGFTINFLRHMNRPEPEGRSSRWVLVAGEARVGQQKILLGLALLADNANNLGKLTLEPVQWKETLRIG